MIYDLIAPIYDSVNGEIDYAAWADFIEKIFERECKKRPELVLDLGCGTGKMTLELAERGYDMTGVDYSPEMLDRARRSAEMRGFGSDVLWLCQDICSFELYGTVDAAVCCLDTLNHLTERAELIKCLRLVHNYLIPNGIFVFDINGKYKFENIYGSESYVMENEKSFCVWQNYYNEKSRKCDFYINLFTEKKDGSYTRESALQQERMYTLRSVKAALSECGFEFIGAYSDFDFAEGSDNDERIYVAAKCIKETEKGNG